MLFRKSLFLGITAGLLSAGGAMFFAKSYNDQLFDYSSVVSYGSIFGACMFVCVFAAVSFWAVQMALKSWGEFVFNVLFAAGTMSSIFYPMDAKIVHEIPDFFPVFAIPLHFFPILAWFAFKPLFFRKQPATALVNATN